MALYLADDGITPVTTHSMIKTFRQCPRETYYKYVLRLQPKHLSKPLTRGKWFHALLETYLNGDDWLEEHRKWCSKYAKLFDEEKENLGDLPKEMERTMQSYLWHYQKDQWEIVDTELLVEAMMPNGHLFRGKIDVLLRDQVGDLWAGDHKTHKRLPDWDFRMLDEQSTLYTWALSENDIFVRGFVWNYITMEAISTPRVVQKGDRFYRRKGSLGSTDYPTLVRKLKEMGAVEDGRFTDVLNEDEQALVRNDLKVLKAHQFDPESHLPPTSPFFRRDYLVKNPDLVHRVMETTMRTSDEMHSYDFSDLDRIVRNVNSCKGFMCQYRSLAMTDLIVGDSQMIQAREYTHGDPLAYYDAEERDV